MRQRWRAVVERVPNAGSGYRNSAREPMEVQSNSRDDQVVGSRGPRSLWREGTSATQTNCRRYCRTSPVRARIYIRMAALWCNALRHTYQCKLTSASVMWSERRSRNIRRAAAFWTDWRRRWRYRPQDQSAVFVTIQTVEDQSTSDWSKTDAETR